MSRSSGGRRYACHRRPRLAAPSIREWLRKYTSLRRARIPQISVRFPFVLDQHTFLGPTYFGDSKNQLVGLRSSGAFGREVAHCSCKRLLLSCHQWLQPARGPLPAGDPPLHFIQTNILFGTHLLWLVEKLIGGSQLQPNNTFGSGLKSESSL